MQGVCSPEPDYTEENIDGYKWKLNTKYYTASVKLCAPKHRTVPSPEFAESVEAVLLYFRPQSRQEFVVLQSWLRTIDQVYSPAVKLLVCDHSGEGDEVPRHELFNFAIDRHLELIELAVCLPLSNRNAILIPTRWQLTGVPESLSPGNWGGGGRMQSYSSEQLLMLYEPLQTFV